MVEISAIYDRTLGQDAMDEVAAYTAQFAFDPSSVSGPNSSSVANSFGGITATWVQNLQSPIDGSKLYGPGERANTGASAHRYQLRKSAIDESVSKCRNKFGIAT